MRPEHLRDRTGLCGLLRLQLLEEAHGCTRIVPGLIKVLEAQEVRFAFVLPRELKELQRNQEACRLTNTEARRTAQEDQRNRRNVDDLRLRSVLRSVTRGHVSDLMRHDAR